MTLLVLYEELAKYFTTCISGFAFMYNCDVHIIRKKVNREAPFNLDLSGMKVYERESYSDRELRDLVQNIKPDAILCGGWSDKGYLQIVSSYKKSIPLVVGFDNQWNGSLKQIAVSFAAPFLITDKFNRCFVPGLQQKKFALKMGFKEEQIGMGAYSCDLHYFNEQYERARSSKQSNFPKRFIYVGRYVEYKGVKDLWKAFVEVQEEMPSDWELWCLGVGDLEAVQHDKIQHVGFVQPEDLEEYIRQTGVFILPSHFEPWGVVVHEFAAAGFPLICSDAVGASSAFLEDGRNGYIYKSGNVNELKDKIRQIMSLDQKELLKMSELSAVKAQGISPEKWAKSLWGLIEQKNTNDPIQ